MTFEVRYKLCGVVCKKIVIFKWNLEIMIAQALDIGGSYSLAISSSSSNLHFNPLPLREPF